MKFFITLFLLCFSIHAASEEPSITSIELAEWGPAKPSARPVKESLALEVIHSRLARRAAELGDAFPAEHIRHKLGNAIAAQFNSAIDAYNTADSTDAANLVLKSLGIFCVEQELKLFKLQNTRWVTNAGTKTYEYDVITLRNILDFAQTEGSELQERVLLSALKVVCDRLDTRSFVEHLAEANVDEIFPLMSDHGLVTIGDVTKENVAQLITKLHTL